MLTLSVAAAGAGGGAATVAGSGGPRGGGGAAAAGAAGAATTVVLVAIGEGEATAVGLVAVVVGWLWLESLLPPQATPARPVKTSPLKTRSAGCRNRMTNPPIQANRSSPVSIRP